MMMIKLYKTIVYLKKHLDQAMTTFCNKNCDKCYTRALIQLFVI